MPGSKRTIWNFFRKESLPDWLESSCPEREPAYVLADGIETAGSAASSPPFVQAASSVITGVDHAARIHPFSYSAVGKAYEARHTHLSLRGADPFIRVSRYLSTAHVSATYIVFSLAGPVFLLGLARHPDPWSAVRHLILVQPALTIREPIARFVEENPDLAPLPILDLVEVDWDVDARLTRALRLAAEQVPVTLLYWPDDPFLDFAGWPERIAETRLGDAVAIPLEVRPFSPVGVREQDMVHEFLQHLRVPHDDVTITALAKLLPASDD